MRGRPCDQSIGTILCQLRRLRHLTQQDLAGERYSKSYVSAIEHGRTAPSNEALRYFAQRLGQADGNFMALLEQPEITEALSVLETPLPLTDGTSQPQVALALLPVLLEQAAFPGVSPPQPLPALAPAMLASLPLAQQASYYVLQGRQARTRGEVACALRAFETALVLAPLGLHAAILHEIGLYHVQRREHHAALGSFLHALHLLSHASRGNRAALRAALELHCAEAYQAVGATSQALAHYETAQAALEAHHDLGTAAKVSTGLGSLLCASLPPSALSHTHPPASIEQLFERAANWLQQGMGLHRASGDRLGEAQARLALVSLQLEWATWRRRRALLDSPLTQGRTPAESLPSSLLDEAAGHCQQVLLTWREPREEAPSAAVDALLYAALASLIRLAVQRATRARLLADEADVAHRERAFASHLSGLVLEALVQPFPPYALVSHVLTLSTTHLAYRSPSLPRLADVPDLLATLDGAAPHRLSGLIEVFAAVGEMAEELGRAAGTSALAHDWYTQANQYQQTALTLASRQRVSGELNPDEVVRLRRRWLALLKERIASPDLVAEAARALLHVVEEES